ncbi:MAG TPA: 16S rRNA (adenine(1518)-N(6)/adenine(1519)-N(6))-dimethyltransferase RsmA [Solirubrobacterales bacterium]|nr:16S rRNA (adenine(1518)-N(6)/adenine(1519)-N(6))-dimethyltransferase RsmA [Solirubrobacterales bacterium]
MSSSARPPERSPRRLGQNFLADPNLLDAIVREADLDPGAVVLEVGGGGGALTERLAPEVAHLHVIEVDERLRGDLEPLSEAAGNVTLVWGDALRVDLRGLAPPPTKMVANLPYSIATPLLIRTISELPSLGRWVVMVQREIADRLRAEPGTKEYGAPTVLVQLACAVELLRTVDPAVFVPRPRVGSALLGLSRTGTSASEGVAWVVRAAFAHRRQSLARSLELGRPGTLDAARRALESIGRPAGARAEQLAPSDFERLAEALVAEGVEL